MTLRTGLAALALILLPVVSYAYCPDRGNQAYSCAPGTVWDLATQSCVKQASS